MNKEDTKRCKNKDCSNPVLEGKYCEFCKKKRKEKRHKIYGMLGSTTILGIGATIKKDAIRQIPNMARKVVKVIFRA